MHPHSLALSRDLDWKEETLSQMPAQQLGRVEKVENMKGLNKKEASGVKE